MTAILSTPSAVVVDEVVARRPRLGDALSKMKCRHTFTNVVEAFAEVDRRRPDLVIVGAGAEDAASELRCLEQLCSRFERPRYLFLASVSSEELAIAALHAGAHRYLREPWTEPMLEAAVSTLVPTVPAGAPPSPLVGGERLIGRSTAICALRERILRVASTKSSVLVIGETGTGKELVAELIHANSARREKPFVCLNAAAIPDTLLESELFGHERGAFTGAAAAQGGKLAAADGGTIFLDEIGDVSLSVQAKLLRAIENKVVYRLGSTRSVQLDARVVAATNVDLERAANEGRFRKDLYFRLNVVRLEIPPLRERREDIPLLVRHYVRSLNAEIGRTVRGISQRALDALKSYHWPGNVRELKNLVEALLVNLAPETTGIVDVPPDVMRQLAFASGAPLSERERLLNALTAVRWNKTKAASDLQISRMTLYRKMQQHGVRGPGS